MIASEFSSASNSPVSVEPEDFSEKIVVRWRMERTAVKEWDSKDVRCCLLSILYPMLHEKIMDVQINNFNINGVQLLCLRENHFIQRDAIYGKLMFEKFQEVRRLAAPKATADRKPKLRAWLENLLNDPNQYYVPNVAQWINHQDQVFRINNLRAIALMWDVDEVKNFQRIMRNRSFNVKWLKRNKERDQKLGENTYEKKTKDFRKLFDGELEIANVWQFIDKKTISELENSLGTEGHSRTQSGGEQDRSAMADDSSCSDSDNSCSATPMQA